MYVPLINELVYIPDLDTVVVVYHIAARAAIQYINTNRVVDYSVREFDEIEYLWMGECLHDCL